MLTQNAVAQVSLRNWTGARRVPTSLYLNDVPWIPVRLIRLRGCVGTGLKVHPVASIQCISFGPCDPMYQRVCNQHGRRNWGPSVRRLPLFETAGSNQRKSHFRENFAYVSQNVDTMKSCWSRRDQRGASPEWESHKGQSAKPNRYMIYRYGP